MREERRNVTGYKQNWKNDFDCQNELKTRKLRKEKKKSNQERLKS